MAVAIIHQQTIFCVLMNLDVCQPIKELEIAKLEEGDEILATSIKRNVKWHKT